MSAPLVLAIPSKGRLQADSASRLATAGLEIIRSGASRSYRARIAGIFAWEFAALGLATALAALGVGTLGAWLVVSRLMRLEWTFLPTVAVGVALGAMALTLAFGLMGTLAALRQRPLALLRNE